MKRATLIVGLTLALGATVLLAGDAAAPQFTSVSFANAITLNSPVLYPTSLAAGDLNGSGFPGLALVGDEDPALLHALGKGNGHFGRWSDKGGTGDSPLFVLLADVDGDGNLDAVSTDDTEASVVVAFGDGKGNFNRGTLLQTGAGFGTYHVAVADLNGDGIPDLVGTVLNPGNDPGEIFVILGEGDRRFKKATHFNSGGYVASGIAVGDLNHDGIPDIVVANEGTQQGGDYGSVAVLLGKGDGRYAKPVLYHAGKVPHAVVLGDFNGDGNLDVAVGSQSKQIHVLLGKGDGTFSAPIASAGGSSGIAAADFNGDGKLDLATARSGVSVLLGNGDGTFQPPANFHVHGHPDDLIVADFNHDGKPDIATIETVGSSFISILLNTTQPPPPQSH